MSKILDRIINYIGTYGIFKNPTDNSVTIDGPLKLENNTGVYIKDAHDNYQQLINWNDSDIITLGNTLVSLTSGQLTGLTTISNSTDAVNKQYVDNRTQDYIVEQYLSSGASGEWSYRKWNSGLFECWASHTLSLTGDGQTGSNFYSKPVYAHLPKLTGIGYSVAGAIAEVTGGNNVVWVGNVGLTGGVPTGTPSDSNTAGTVWFRVIRSIAIPASGTFRIYVMCRWYNT